MAPNKRASARERASARARARARERERGGKPEGAYRGVSGHLDAGVQEVVEVVAELAGGGGELAAGAAGGVDHVAGRLVELGGRVSQLTLGFLEGLGGERDLDGRGGGGRPFTLMFSTWFLL